MSKFEVALLSLALSIAPRLHAEDRPIDIDRSTITIHVGKAGLFSAAGHEHWVDAPLASGTIDETQPKVEFVVQTAKMRVKDDPNIDGKTQTTIQKDMQDMTLEITKYPEIRFQSTRIEQVGTAWKVSGTLTLHGVSKPVQLMVQHKSEPYTGFVTLKQTDFGIKPISVAGGTIKVKNEIDINFEIYARRPRVDIKED